VQAPSEPSGTARVLVAAGVGLLGWGLGAAAAYAIQRHCVGEFCAVGPIFYGGAAGGGLGLAVGAHLGNRKRGSFPLDLLTSGAVWGLGYLAMKYSIDQNDDTGVLVTAITLPLIQLFATVLVEGATSPAVETRAP